MPKSILLTGSTGVLGSHVLNCLEAEGHSVTRFKGNLLDQANILDQLEERTFDLVAHFAAMVPVKDVEAAPAQAYAVNVSGTINLLNALLDRKASSHFFYASSSHVYTPKDTPILESDPVGASSLYGRTKLHAEQIAGDICQSAGLRFTAARIFSFYDERQSPPFLYPSIKARLASEDLTQPFELFGAQSTRDICSAQEIGQKCAHLIQKEAQGIFNIGTGSGTQIQDFVQDLSPVELNIIAKGEPNHLIADISKYNTLIRK